METRVMEMRERLLVREHLQALTTMSNLAFTPISQTRSDEAISLLETCFQLQEQVLGRPHPYTEASLRALNG